MIQVITFDLDGVYFPNGKTNFKNAIMKMGVLENEFKRVFAQSSEMNEQYKLGKMSDEEFWTWAVRAWKLDLNWQEVIKLMIDSYDVDGNIVEIIMKLRANGYKTAICTSNFPARINGLQERFGFLDNFDVKVISYEVGANKPNKRIYEKLVEFSSVPANEIVFADDHPESVAGSQSAGITTFLYEGFGKYIEQLKSVGVIL
ncbi:HAD-IA family hydrolase [bacterium]|nr:HAD-IA family hydrolase [bacterium]